MATNADIENAKRMIRNLGNVHCGYTWVGQVDYLISLGGKIGEAANEYKERKITLEEFIKRGESVSSFSI